MYNLQANLTDNYSSNDSLNNLLDQIDATILKMALCEYNNVRLSLNNKCISLDDYDDLMTYKYILTNKLLGCNCLDDVLLVNIVSKIKSLII